MCNKCNTQTKSVIQIKADVNKDGNIKTIELCQPCLIDLTYEILTWNPDLINKAFNNKLNWVDRK